MAENLFSALTLFTMLSLICGWNKTTAVLRGFGRTALFMHRLAAMPVIWSGKALGNGVQRIRMQPAPMKAEVADTVQAHSEQPTIEASDAHWDEYDTPTFIRKNLSVAF